MVTLGASVVRCCITTLCSFVHDLPCVLSYHMSLIFPRVFFSVDISFSFCSLHYHVPRFECPSFMPEELAPMDIRVSSKLVHILWYLVVCVYTFFFLFSPFSLFDLVLLYICSYIYTYIGIHVQCSEPRDPLFFESFHSFSSLSSLFSLLSSLFLLSLFWINFLIVALFPPPSIERLKAWFNTRTISISPCPGVAPPPPKSLEKKYLDCFLYFQCWEVSCCKIFHDLKLLTYPRKKEERVNPLPTPPKKS